MALTVLTLVVAVTLLAAQTKPSEVRRLTPGETVERQLPGGETHSYKVNLKGGEFLYAIIEQRGIDVAVALIGPDGKKLVEVDSPNGTQGAEPLFWIVDAPGEHQFEVRSLDKGAAPGRYEVKVQEVRGSTEIDKKRLAAQQAFVEATNLVGHQTAEAMQKAVEKYKESLPQWQEAAEAERESLTANSIGAVYYQLGEQQKALEFFNQALTILRTIGDRRGEASTLSNISLIHANSAKKAFDKAEELVDEGSVSSLREALKKYEEGLQLFRAIGDRHGEAKTLHNIGFVYDSLGEMQKALDYLTQALSVRKAVGDSAGEGLTLSAIGGVYDSLGQMERALDYYNQALQISSASSDPVSQSTSLHNIGNVYDSIGEKQKALDYYNQALQISRVSGDRVGEAATLRNIGRVYDSMGEKQKALDYYHQALPISKAVGDRRVEASNLNNIGLVYHSLGENQKALEYYQQALTIRKDVGDRRGEAWTLNDTGVLFDSLGEKRKALEYYNQALPILVAIGDRRSEGTVLNNIGVIYSSLGEKQTALQYYHRALPIRKALSDRGGEALTLYNIGRIHDFLGEKQKALEYYNQTLPIWRAVVDRRGEATTLTAIGLVYDSQGATANALQHYYQALPIHRAIGGRDGEATTLDNLMFLFAKTNRRTAIFYGKQAINAIQQLRSNIGGLEKGIQQTFLRAHEERYRRLADILVTEGRLPEAHQVLNLFKDQQFFDFNRDTQKQASPVTLTAREALIAERYEQTTKRVEVVGQQLDELKRKIGARQPNVDEAAQRQQLEAQLKAASDEFLAVLKQAETEFSRPPSDKDKVGEIADTRELQTALRQLKKQTGQDAVAIYTLVGADSYHALIITPNNIAAVSQPVKGDALNEKARQLWALLQSPKYDPIPLSQELCATVFKPIESQLPKDTSTILWSLDGNLRYLPMAVLHDGRQYLVERYNHVVFTRADSERLLRAVSPRWTGLGLGSSGAHTVEMLGDKISFNSLPGVTEELRALFRQKDSPSGVLEGEVLPDARFTKAAMLSALKQKRPLVHISSHFAFRPGDEARSFLLLGDGSPMTLEEMKAQTNLFSGVELLTLSACNTAAQQAGANGREIDGFAELAQRLGAGSVMATLWPVADNSTPWLMREFYQTRQQGNGLTKAEAIRRAQLALLNGTAQTKPLPAAEKGPSSQVQVIIKSNDAKRDSGATRSDFISIDEKDAPSFSSDPARPFAHPYYWAPFILIGNWK